MAHANEKLPMTDKDTEEGSEKNKEKHNLFICHVGLVLSGKCLDTSSMR